MLFTIPGMLAAVSHSGWHIESEYTAMPVPAAPSLIRIMWFRDRV